MPRNVISFSESSRSKECCGLKTAHCSKNCFAMFRHFHLSSVLALCFVLHMTTGLTNSIRRYAPNWASLDARPLPDWYDKAKVGIFIHWGVYSVPSYGSEWFWQHWKDPNPTLNYAIRKFMETNYKPNFTYQEFAPDFTGEFFSPNLWADIIENSGAKYVVFTSKHHDGYTLWPSKYSFSWNSMDVGPHRDVIGELSQAIRAKKDIRFGLYHSLYEWFNPLWLNDKKNNFSTHDFVNNKVYPEMIELVNTYRPEVFWSDGEWEANSSYWRSEEFLAWLYNESPVADRVVANDRWGRDTLCHHGGFYTCQDRFTPGKRLPHKWENAMTLDKYSWGYNRLSTLDGYLTDQQLIDTLVQTIAYGGNILINVGPSKDGMISPIYEERLRNLGVWLKINGEAIYESEPWDVCQNDTATSGVWYTTKNFGRTLYVIILKWPSSNVIHLSCAKISNKSRISMLGLANVTLQGIMTEKHLLKISLPDKVKVDSVNHWGWTLKILDSVSP